jgi:alkanesulfonate monooxygenase SsuD/methylene tetrahydromethanopterin reductase-like flavin-dependent oxidoreductase (luciferase family)
MDECLTVLRPLLEGKPVSFHGEFFELDNAKIVPSPARTVPVIVGGRSDAAVRRAARFGDGWIGIWNSPRRFGEVVAAIDDEAAAAGRRDHPRQHAMQVWCGIANDGAKARMLLSTAMHDVQPHPAISRHRHRGGRRRGDQATAFAVGMKSAIVERHCEQFVDVPRFHSRVLPVRDAAHGRSRNPRLLGEFTVRPTVVAQERDVLAAFGRVDERAAESPARPPGLPVAVVRRPAFRAAAAVVCVRPSGPVNHGRGFPENEGIYSSR